MLEVEWWQIFLLSCPKFILEGCIAHSGWFLSSGTDNLAAGPMPLIDLPWAAMSPDCWTAVRSAAVFWVGPVLPWISSSGLSGLSFGGVLSALCKHSEYRHCSCHCCGHWSHRGSRASRDKLLLRAWPTRESRLRYGWGTQTNPSV